MKPSWLRQATVRIARSALACTVLALAAPGHVLASDQFHALLIERPKVDVKIPMIIIGLEKGSQREVGAVQAVLENSAACNLGKHCLRFPEDPNTESKVADQYKVFWNRLNDKSMYVSHILTLEGGQGCKLVYTSYDGVSCAAGRVKSMPAKHMESSWDALEVSLKRELLEQYRSECARNRCPTHVFVLATGWNQSEQSSLESYQAWAKNISDDLEVRGGAVRPMFVGISWPANWVVPFISFVNKAHDADEAGFIWGSILVNRPLAQLHRELGLKTVLVGHSFGAKILTSAVAGKELIEPLGCDGESGLTVIGLQAAFSTGRFAMGRGFERNPYRDVRRCGTRLAYTVSTHDEGVRVAPMQIFARETGYVGGKKGFESALLDPDIFVRSKADSAAGLVLEPPGASPSGRILLIDSSTGIHCHNDVADPFVAHLISSVVLGEYSGREGVLDMDDVCKHR